MYERKATLLYMLGWIEGTKRPIKRSDAIILLDQTLNKMCQPRTTEEERSIFDEMGEEQSFVLLQMGINTKQQKEIGKRGYL